MPILPLVLFLKSLVVFSVLAMILQICSKIPNKPMKKTSVKKTKSVKKDVIESKTASSSKEIVDDPAIMENSTKTVRSKEELRALDSLKIQRKKAPPKAEILKMDKSQTSRAESEDDSQEIHIVMENVEKKQGKEESRLMPPDQWKKDKRSSRSTANKEPEVKFDTTKQPKRKKNTDKGDKSETMKAGPQRSSKE